MTMRAAGRLFFLLWLKCRDLLAMRSLIVFFIMMPPLFGLIAGTANLANRTPEIRIGLVDQDQSPGSLALANRLAAGGWRIVMLDEQEADQALVRQSVDGILTVQPGYDASLADLKQSRLSYQPAEGSLVTSLVREAVAAAVLPEYSKRQLTDRLAARFAQTGTRPSPDWTLQFDQAMDNYAGREARLDITYIGRVPDPPVLTYVVNDYSMEVFFLSVYAIMGLVAFADAGLQKRLATTRRGLLLDYLLSIKAIFLSGLVQILLYSAAMLLTMGQTINPETLGLLLVFLLLMISLGQLLVLLPRELRLYLSLLVLLLSAVGGGCFFQLSERLIRGVGQYLPHGWVLSALRGYPVLPPAVPLALSLLCLALGYWIQVRRVKSIA